MVRTLSMLRNTGKFDNVTVGANLPFAPLTVIYAENARGKTTLAAILRSLATGNSNIILERHRLNAPHQPHIVVELNNGGPAVFQNGVWSQTLPQLTIFDDLFVAENVCSGIEVSSSQRQNLHELIIGSEGVALNAALQEKVERIEQHNRELRERVDAIPADRRGNITVERFCALQAEDGLPRKIADAERSLAAAQSAERVAERNTFSELVLPKIGLDEVQALLAKGLPDLDAAALARVQEHLQTLGVDGEIWVADGLKILDEGESGEANHCPFCAQDLEKSPVLTHYRIYFADAYDGLKQEILEATTEFEQHQEGEIPATFEREVREAVEQHQFWKDFADVPEVAIDTQQIAVNWRSAREAVKALLTAKIASPLETIPIPPEVRHLVEQHNAGCNRVELLSDELLLANQQLDLVKEQAREANAVALASDLQRLKAIEARFEADIAPLCEAYLAEKEAKAVTETERTAARAALDLHRENAFPAYGDAINDYLRRLNASFRVGPVDPVNNRAGSSANYTLLIDGSPVPLGANNGQPSFSNTLSAGDRNTLALAFFFSSIENDPDRANKIVVIDDPMTSLDEHRTLHTLHEMDALTRQVSAMIVLSHSKPFLLGVWDKCQQIQKVGYLIARAGTGSTLASWNVSDAMVTEHDRRFLAAIAYLENAEPENARRVAESLRPMLEAYFRVAYPNDFPPGSLLGPFHNTCLQRMGTPRQILNVDDAGELRALLDFANRYHHDTNPAYATELINDAELENFAQRVLGFIRR